MRLNIAVEERVPEIILLGFPGKFLYPKTYLRPEGN